MKHSSRRRKEIEHGTIDSVSLSEAALLNLGHYHSSTEDYLKRLAAREGNPNLIAPFADRLSGLLADTALRAVSGDSSLVPYMRADGFPVDQRGTHSLQAVYQPAQNLHDRSPRALPPLKRQGKHRMSAAARKKIRDAQKARWAKFHAQRDGKPKQKLTPAQLRAVRANAILARAAYLKKHGGGSKKKLTRTPEQRAAISEARKLYWKKRKAQEVAAERDE